MSSKYKFPVKNFDTSAGEQSNRRMIEQARPNQIHEKRNWVDDIWGGLAAMLVAVPSAVAFGIIVFSALGSEYTGLGATAGLLGAAALGLTTPFIGRTAGLIATPCAPAATVLSALVVGMLDGRGGQKLTPQEIIALMALVTTLSALLQLLYGAIGGGKLIKYVPFQVVTGYLSGVGVLIAIGQIPKLLGVPKGTPFFTSLISWEVWKIPGLVVGVVTIVVMVLAPRVTKRIPAPILALASGIATYFALSLSNPSLLSLQGNPLIIGPLQATGSLLDSIKLQMGALSGATFETLKLAIFPALTLSTLLSIDTLKTCVGLDALTRTRHNSNRELVGQGIGNFASAMLGGMPGAGAMGPTLVNVSSGGHTPLAGVFSGIFAILALLLLGPFIAWVPIGALAGILLVIAYRMFDHNLFRLLLHKEGRIDFILIAGVIGVAVGVDLIAATGFGVAMAIIVFIRNQIRDSVVYQKADLSHMSSKTQRNEHQRKTLREYGTSAWVCKLQGNLFFGTTDQLFTELSKEIATAKYLLLDLRKVRSLDYTALHLLQQMQSQLIEKGGQLIFSGMPSGLFDQRKFERYLKQMGLLQSQQGIRVFDTLDSALEWMENQILTEQGDDVFGSEESLNVAEFNLFRDLNSAAISAIQKSVVERKVVAGEKVFTSGHSGDELFLVRSGSVRVLLPLAGGKYHHLTTIGRDGFFGEVAFLDHDIRTADVEAKTDSNLYVLSRQKFNEASHADASLGAQIFARIALVVAKRLRTTDAELRLLEDR